MKRNLVLFSLCILLGTGVASAQTVVFNVGTANTDVANTGRAEVLGQVTLSGNITCGAAGAACVSTAGTIQVTFPGVAIDNAIATANVGLINTNGIEVCEISVVAAEPLTCNVAANYITTPYTVNNTPGGGVVSFGVNNAIPFPAGAQVVIRGVRGRIDQSSANTVNTQIFASLGTSPSTIASFSPISQVVATSKDPLTVAFSAATILQCIPGGTATVTITEGFNTAFVDERMPAPPANPRPLFVGADGRLVSNSQVHLVITNLPTGVTLTWPALSAFDSGTGFTGAQLVLLSQSAKGDTATYEYRTPDQGFSDINTEQFVITLTDPTNIGLSGTNADFGVALGQGQMYPPAPANNAIATGPEVRYNHPLENVPPDQFLIIGPCTTNLLFPWMAFISTASYDTGFAIANTSTDPYGTLPQTGTCTLNFYPTNDSTLGTTPAALPAVVVTTPTIASGATFATNISNISALNTADFTGYMIAVCKFQYGHGFAYITNTIGTPSALAQGYVALIIPDPVINLGRLPSDSTFEVFESGEGLAQ